MKLLDSSTLLYVTGGDSPGVPHANPNAPGGTNVLFIHASDGTVVCANGSLTTTNSAPLPTPNANGIYPPIALPGGGGGVQGVLDLIASGTVPILNALCG